MSYIISSTSTTNGYVSTWNSVGGGGYWSSPTKDYGPPKAPPQNKVKAPPESPALKSNKKYYFDPKELVW